MYVVHSDTGYEIGNHAWQKQERFKGRGGIDFIAGWGGTTWAGWSFCDIPEGSISAGVPLFHQITPQEANTLTDGQLKVTPAFKKTPLSMLTSSTITLGDRNQLLAKAIPALSGPAGSRSIYIPGTTGRNLDMNDSSINWHPNNWGRTHAGYGTSWLHGDLKDMAYFYNFRVYQDVVEKGGLK